MNCDLWVRVAKIGERMKRWEVDEARRERCKSTDAAIPGRAIPSKRCRYVPAKVRFDVNLSSFLKAMWDQNPRQSFSLHFS